MAEIKGILGTKLGMTQIFDDTRAIPVTVIQAGPCFVAQVKTEEKDGYSAVQLAFGATRPNGLTKPEQGHFDKHGGQPARHVVELRTDDAAVLRAGPGAPGRRVRGGRASRRRRRLQGQGVRRRDEAPRVQRPVGIHGTERKHRSPGAIGACATPSRVFKGMRMAGQMGNERVTVLNLEVVHADPERNLLLLRGAIPGPDGGLVMVRSAVKAPATKGGR